MIHQLISENQNKLKGFFRKKGVDQWDAEDLAQETLIKFMLYYKRANCQSNSAYLYAIAHSVYVNSIRKNANSNKLLDTYIALEKVSFGGEEMEDSPEMILEAEELLSKFIDSVHSLSPVRKMTFLLRNVEGYSLSEIARHRNVTVSAVEKSAMQAKFFIQKRLNSNVL